MITVPGTLHRPVDDRARGVLLAGLRRADPDEIGAEVPDLDVLTLDPDGGPFVLRLEVDADNRTAAGEAAVELAREAFAAAGFEGEAVATGSPVITGIDVG
ncbi:hypothetical protein [Kitasatospora sp. NPDC059571]|uniref:hypothetical protein n=1 Tax=Kitasatospora sp. NPDC059571 TaxID=3346871 RepID=UPI0036C4EDC1